MCVCVYVFCEYVCVCLFVCMHTCIYVYIHVCILLCTNVRVFHKSNIFVYKFYAVQLKLLLYLLSKASISFCDIKKYLKFPQDTDIYAEET